MKQIGEFGPPNVEIVSFFASDPDSGDAVFSTGDEIGIDFNIPTNQANLPNDIVTRAQLDSVFQFSMSIGQDYVGRWKTPASLRITILNATEDPSNQLFHPPFVGFSGLTVSVKKSGLLTATRLYHCYFELCSAVTCACISGNLRNTPAVCQATESVSGFLIGDFGIFRLSFSLE
jgi:hypothetical protein